MAREGTGRRWSKFKEKEETQKVGDGTAMGPREIP